jgi:hypothetical protein
MTSGFDRIARLIKIESEDIRKNISEIRTDVGNLRGELGGLRKEMHDGFADINRRLDHIIQIQLDEHTDGSRNCRPPSSQNNFQPTATTIDGVPATMFYGSNSVMSDTREIWFINAGLLYEVTTYKQLDTWLLPILQTWQFTSRHSPLASHRAILRDAFEEPNNILVHTKITSLFHGAFWCPKRRPLLNIRSLIHGR